MSGYARLDQHADIPMEVIQPTVHVTVGSSQPPAVPGQLYYGESHGLYQPISQNQVIEHHAPAPTVVVSAGGAAAPAPVPTPVSAPAPAPAPVSGSAYPAMAYAQAYPMAAHAMPIAAVPPPSPLVSVVPPVPQNMMQLRGMLHARFVEFDMSRYFREGWAFARPNLCSFFGALVFWMIVMSVAFFALWFAFVAAHWESAHGHEYSEDQPSDGSEEMKRGFQIGTAIRGMLFEALLATPVCAGFMAAVFEAMKDNQHMKFRSLFAGFACPYYFRLAGLALLLGVFTRLLSMLFLIPGIYFSIVTSFAVPLHLQYSHIKLGPIHAMGLSARVINRYCCSFFGFLVCAVLLNVAGALCFGVGLLFTIPWTVAAGAYCYHHLIGVNGMPVIMPANQAVFPYAALQAPQPIVTMAQPYAQPQQYQYQQHHQQQQPVVVVVQPQQQQHH